MINWKDYIFTQPKNNLKYRHKRPILVCTEDGSIEPAWVDPSGEITDADDDRVNGIVAFWGEISDINSPMVD